jgi:hypothetical protein
MWISVCLCGASYTVGSRELKQIRPPDHRLQDGSKKHQKWCVEQVAWSEYWAAGDVEQCVNMWCILHSWQQGAGADTAS